MGTQAGKAESKSLESKSRQTTVKVRPVSLKSRGSKLNYFLLYPCRPCFLSQLYLPATAVSWKLSLFKLPALHFAPVPQQRPSQSSPESTLAHCPQAHVYPTHTTCFSPKEGIPTIQSQSPGSHRARRSPRRSSTQCSSASSTQRAGSFPPPFTRAEVFLMSKKTLHLTPASPHNYFSFLSGQILQRLNSKLTVSTSSPHFLINTQPPGFSHPLSFQMTCFSKLSYCLWLEALSSCQAVWVFLLTCWLHPLCSSLNAALLP